MANAKVYIHELVDIVGSNRARYQHHVTANWAPVGRAERNMLCLGVWSTVGSTERWPQVVNMWELDGWQGLAASFRREFGSPTHQDPSLAAWWEEAGSYRSGGYDRLLIPAAYTPTVEEAVARGIKGAVYYHEIVRLRPRGAPEYLARLEEEWLPVARRIGLRLVGAYRSAMVNDSEAIVLWAMDDWEAWAGVELAYQEDEEVADWHDEASRDGLVVDWRAKLLVPAPLCPLNTGTIL